MARILLVDDKEEVLQTIGPLLRSQGHHVLAVREGRRAIQVIRSRRKLDLLVTDIRMAPINGLQVVRVAHQIRPTMDIVVVSAFLDGDTVKEALELGCSEYVKKPYDVDAVIAAIAKIIERRKRDGVAPSIGDPRRDDWMV